MNYKEYVSIDIDINILDDFYVQEMSQRVMFLALTEATALQRKWTASQAITVWRNMYMLLRNEVWSGNQEELPTEGRSNLEADGQDATWLGDKEWGGARGMRS